MSSLNGTVSACLELKYAEVDGGITVPTNDEILFVLEIIDQIGKPALQVIECLVKSDQKWDNVSRNDFCRLVYFRLFLLTFTVEIILDISKLAAPSFSACLLLSKKFQKRLWTLVSTRNMRWTASSCLIWTLLLALL